jgi:hypothetical protein
MGLLNTDELTEAISTERQRDDRSSVPEEPAFDVPVELTDLDLWANYMDDDLYEMDRKVREFLKRTRYQRQAKGGYRTTASVVFAWIYGRQPEARDGAACRLLHQLLKYYCTSYTGRTTFHGKAVNRVYRFSKFSGNAKRPYSLKLRMEEANGGNVFKSGPNAGADKRTHGRRADRQDC